MGDSPLVGRDAEMATLVSLLDDVRAGRGRAVVLLGEAGIGKTRLAEALAGAAAGSGLTVAWGRCPDSEVPPYWPWSQVVGHLLGADAAPLLGSEAQGGRPALFAGVVDALAEATTTGPAAVLLEDVHWADASSLALLQFVVGALPGMPLLLALTARDDPWETREEISTGLADLPPAVMRLSLPGLDKEATAVLVEHVAGRDTADRLAIPIHERTGGNPFFITEVARLQAVRGGTGAVDVPPGVHQVLSRRLARLSQPSFDLLGAASVAGEPHIEVLAAVTGQPEDQVLELLDEALRARLVEECAAQARTAAEMARRIGDAGTEAAALAALCDALAGPDDVAERLAAADRMVRLSEAAGDPLLLLLARRLRLVARLERGDLPGVDAEVAAYARTAEHLRLPLYQWPVPLWRGMRTLMDGDFEAAWRLSEEAEELGLRAGSANADLMVFTLRMAVARARGTIAELAPVLLEKWRPWLEEYPTWACCFAAVLAQAGRPDEGRPYLRRVMTAGLEAIPKDSEYLEILWQLGDAAMLLDERDAARAVHELLTPYAGLWAVDGIGGACYGPVSEQLARLAGCLGEQRPPPEPGTQEGEFRREGKLWNLRFRGEAAAVPHSKGMADLAALLAQPGREIHVLDLVEAAGGPSAGAVEGDIGPVLDARARAAYKARLVELEEEIAAAEADADLGQVEHLRAERDFVATELGGALGLGGRIRTGGDRVERARKAVTMRIATALKTIDGAHPALARHLRLAVATGRFCVYRPESLTSWKT